jgi:multiple sugar transport system substrate-binding protein
MKRKSLLVVMLLMAGILLTLVPLALHAQDKVTVTYWHTHSDAEAAQLGKLIDMFEKDNPGIHIEPTQYAYDDFKKALLTAIAGGEAPDVVRMDIVWVPQFAQQGALLQLDTAMPDFKTLADGVFPGPLATNYWDGKYWGLPLDTNTQVLLWNQDLFDKAGIKQPPATVQEFADDACKLSSGDKQYGYALGGTYFWAPAPLFYAMGGKVVDDKLTTADGYINGKESVAAFQTLVDLFKKGCLSPNVLGGGIGTAQGHATGLYAMIIDGPWMVDIYKGQYPDFKVNFAPIPTGSDGKTSSVVGGEDVVVSSTTQHQAEALTWVKYLMSEPAQLFMGQVGVMPTLKSLTGSKDLPPYFEVFMKQLETAQARVAHPKWDDMDGAINAAFTKMLKGDATVQEALDEAAKTIDGLLAAK